MLQKKGRDIPAFAQGTLPLTSSGSLERRWCSITAKSTQSRRQSKEDANARPMHKAQLFFAFLLHFSEGHLLCTGIFFLGMWWTGMT